MLPPEYRRLVQQRYLRAAGLAHYQWRVLDRHSGYNFVAHPEGGAKRIPRSVYCQLLVNGAYQHLLLPITGNARLAESLHLFAQALHTTNVVARYLLIHKSYESLGSHPFADYTAVRHGLAHASTALSKPKTVEALTRLFGSTRIDLTLRPHVKQMYIQCGALLRDLDGAQATALEAALPTAILLSSHAEALPDWRITGWEGFNKPLLVRDD